MLALTAEDVIFLTSCMILLARLVDNLYQLYLDRPDYLRWNRAVNRDNEPALDPATCRRIIAGYSLNENMTNLASQTMSRILPYGKLRMAFGIHNSFTSHDLPSVGAWLTSVREHILLNGEQWENLSVFIRNTVYNSLNPHKVINQDSSGRPQTRINLTTLIQAITMQVVLLIFFRIGEGQVPHHEIMDLVGAINRTLMSAKSIKTLVRFKDNKDLQHALMTVFQNPEVVEPQTNPLNYILPAYETLWHSALMLFNEIGFDTGREHPEWQQLIVSFSLLPSRDRFRSRMMKENISAEDLVNENLRLHPPIPEIPRVYKFSQQSQRRSTDMIAGIKTCHTSPHIWGGDADKFNPSRWRNVTDEQREAFMPFGVEPFRCPARTGFGPMVTGIMVGALFTGIGVGGAFEYEGEGEHGPDNDWRLEQDNLAWELGENVFLLKGRT